MSTSCRPARPPSRVPRPPLAPSAVHSRTHSPAAPWPGLLQPPPPTHTPTPPLTCCSLPPPTHNTPANPHSPAPSWPGAPGSHVSGTARHPWPAPPGCSRSSTCHTRTTSPGPGSPVGGGGSSSRSSSSITHLLSSRVQVQRHASPRRANIMHAHTRAPCRKASRLLCTNDPP